MSNPVTHGEILAKDVDALQRFYTAAFGWEVQDVVDGAYHVLADPDADRGILHVGVAPAPQDRAGHLTFYVEVDDPAAVLEQIERLGGRTVRPPARMGTGPTLSLLEDPEGHVIGLVERH